jgi:citrate lyase subunit beta/citryl-CoA lyase
MVCEAVSEKRFGDREVIIRVNGSDSPWGVDDLSAAVASEPDGVLLPKVSKASDIAAAQEVLESSAPKASVALWAMIETPMAILNIKEIAAASRTTNLSAFVMGTNDLAKELRALFSPGREAFIPSLCLSVAAARAFGLTVVDGVFNDLSDVFGFEQECRQGRRLGFDGKTLIHPKQIERCNYLYSPSREEVSQARDIIEAFANPENEGIGVINVNGKMTELLHLEEAKRIVTIAETLDL